MIDVAREELMTLRDAAEMMPGRRPGKRASLRSIWRYATKGCRGEVLDTVRVAGRRLTSREAMARFAEATNYELADPVHQSSEADRQRADRAGRELENAGI